VKITAGRLGQLAKAVGEKALPLIDGLVKRDVDDVVEIVAPRTIKSLDDLPLMSPEQVKAALPSGYSKSSSWAYSIHDHHFYPMWLGGRTGGPKIRVRGFEHVTDLEPALFEHMKRNIPELTQKTRSQVQQLIRSGRVTQEEITEFLFEFYKSRYPNLSEEVIREALRKGI